MLIKKKEEKTSSFRFKSLAELYKGLGATKSITRLLVANNGLAAVKGIESIKAWLYEHVGDPEAIHHVVMATPEDLAANAEFIAMSDQHVLVPGGSNLSNYANVDVIMRCAMQHACHAVYPGWGHASENPALPRECERRKHIEFLGPSEDAMFVLGDKIASTIVAQSNGVLTVPWSGDTITLPRGVFEIPPAEYEKAYISSVDECIECCRRIGFPVMLKAAEGGGGKGIRCCNSFDVVKDMFFAVQAEVKGCHIFAMRMLENIRHLEVQLLADNYGSCIAVRTRDCSVQRRHQKIIEEGPVFDVDPEVVKAMEEAAIRLAKAVGYRGLGTVEYMYEVSSHQFYFLELNPRIQVEHPVSEMISGINLPAALLCVGMGVRLDRIPEVRAYYGESPYGTSVIDFESRIPIPPKGHVIAVRITAEDTEEGFRPSSGRVDEINFKNSQECWGYFSVSSGGSIHQYSDSQFGHVFSTGVTREDARRGMIRALRNLVVRGEIRTSTSYVLSLLESPVFCNGEARTSWVDMLIAQQASGAPDMEDVFGALISASIFRCYNKMRENKERYAAHLSAGHEPSTDLLVNHWTQTLVRGMDQYVVTCGMMSETEFAISLNDSVILVPFRILKSGALQVAIAEKTLVAYVTEEPIGLRITIKGKATTFSTGSDPTKVKTTVPGRLVRYLVEDGGHVEKETTIAEIEVMKMILPIRVGVDGIIHHRLAAGSSIVLGALLAEITPDDPTTVAHPALVKETWPPNFLEKRFERPDNVTRVRAAFQTMQSLIAGYHFKECSLEERLKQVFNQFLSVSISQFSFEALNIPVLMPSSSCHLESPNEKLQLLYASLLRQYIEVERAFAGRKRKDSVSALRDQGVPSEEIFGLDFAHFQPPHHDAVYAVLCHIEEQVDVLKLLKPELEALSALQSPKSSSPAQFAKYLCRKVDLPSFSERKVAFSKALQAGITKDLLQSVYGYDIICSVMFDRHNEHLTQLCLDFLIQKECVGDSTPTGLDIFPAPDCWVATFQCEPLADPGVLSKSIKRRPAEVESRVYMVFINDQRLNASFVHALERVPVEHAQQSSSIGVIFSVSRDFTQNEVSALLTDLLAENRDCLREFRELTKFYFIVYGMVDGPHMLTFSKSLTDFTEETLLRNVPHPLSHRLELDRLSNYDVEMQPTPYKDVHLFKGTPKDKSSSPIESRIFARVVLSASDVNLNPWSNATDADVGHMLTKCTAALEVAKSRLGVSYPISNHIFVKMIDVTFDVSTLHELLEKAASNFASRLTASCVTDVELSFQVQVKAGFIPMRVTVDSPSLYQANYHIYFESTISGKMYLSRGEISADVQIPESPTLEVGWDSPEPCNSHVHSLSKLQELGRLLPSTHPNELSASPVSPEKEQPFIPFEPYPLLDGIAIKRLQAHSHGTPYVEDWPVLFEQVIRSEWMHMLCQRGFPPSRIPPFPLHLRPLYCSKEDNRSVTMNASEGVERCGMLAWLITYCPPSYWDPSYPGQFVSRSFVLVANDITYYMGSMSVGEDNVFKAASAFARQERVPFIYASSNSGARIGLCNAAKKKFLVDFNAKGELHYIYFTERDYEELMQANIVLEVEKRVLPSGEVRYVLLGIEGDPKERIGVENLSGAGLIAGEMSRSYSQIPTISIVSGLSAGIGAYLNRLGRRIIQTDDTPMVLTGFSALNRVLGKDVYTDNSQLGGKNVMASNGTTHFSTQHDYGSVKTAVRWLNFAPSVCDMRRCSPRVLTLPVPDPVDRDVTFLPQPSVPYDPHFLVTGTGETTGLFDRGSWMESMEKYAKTVVTGRATLGGIPCGVVLVETRLSKKHCPADPADPSSASSFILQAGQVWYPDSARKAAEAIEDFYHERLPVFILANWRGFAGGSRDMFEEILKFGASIVDNMRIHNAPVFVYIPPYGELRGGAWAVVDTQVSDNGVVEMYCAETARGGILEASGVASLKFRAEDVKQLIRRCHPEWKDIDPAEAAAMEKQLFARYSDAAVSFADLHDTYFRMNQVGAVRGVVPWRTSRNTLYWKLVRKLKEIELANHYVDIGEASHLREGVELVGARYPVRADADPSSSPVEEEQRKVRWLQEQLGHSPDDLPSRSTYFAPHQTTREEELRCRLKKVMGECHDQSETVLTGWLKELFARDPVIASAASKALAALPRSS